MATSGSQPPELRKVEMSVNDNPVFSGPIKDSFLEARSAGGSEGQDWTSEELNSGEHVTEGVTEQNSASGEMTRGMNTFVPPSERNSGSCCLNVPLCSCYEGRAQCYCSVVCLFLFVFSVLAFVVDSLMSEEGFQWPDKIQWYMILGLASLIGFFSSLFCTTKTGSGARGPTADAMDYHTSRLR